LMVVALFVGQIWNATHDFDPDAFGLYKEFATKLLESGDIADAFVWAVPVEEGVSAEDVKESMKSLAVARNFLFDGRGRKRRVLTRQQLRIIVLCPLFSLIWCQPHIIQIDNSARAG